MQRENIPLEIAIKPVTSNPARILKLSSKGRIQPGMDGDLCLLRNDDLTIHTVIAKGQIMVRDGKPLVYGTFEKRG